MTSADYPILQDLKNSAQDGCLIFAGISLLRLTQRIGSTPFFAYSRDLITARVRELRQDLPDDVHLSYAIKANPMPAVVQYLSGLVDGFDIASAGELKVALDAGMRPQNVSFAGPGKQPEELSRAVAAEILINVESERELRAVASIGTQLKVTPRIALRVNPGYELKSTGLRMGGGAQPFGIDAEAIPDILRSIETLAVEFAGFQIFAGSQNLARQVSGGQRKS